MTTCGSVTGTLSEMIWPRKGRQPNADRLMILPPTNDNLERAAAALRQGELVAFPTETVYGLGADASNGIAVAAIFELKGRPRFNPLIVHVRDRQSAEKLAYFNEAADRLASAFWPGALTLVAKKRLPSPLSDLVSAGLDSVALRVPNHSIAQSLLGMSDRPLAAPSANRSGQISPTTAAHVDADFDDPDLLIVDGGATTLGLESTVVDIISEPATLLRPGAITRAEIETILGRPLAVKRSGEAPRSPGLLERHYAPRTELVLGTTEPGPEDVVLAFGPAGELPPGSINLSPSGDLKEAAATLFNALRTLDACGAARIAVMPIPTQGLGEAINDRLRRAAT